ncbi:MULTISPECIES: hypothetical protein [unclassified Gordonia (in: high G+C Gram-positive bacteria)]|uniref:hypothetical protein n=1 Tax=unclassified Gordonia (in: high G+C Gram-positive bacteria) TaxID=2657482 RepID=UPI0009AEFDF3|nr:MULTISPECIES: hypothetical protein [unclassified Gordonia (in: high G+C Gram-positive bacteria)]MDF3282222.1 hypothetical protein [Gordonia sp. N1V]OPX15861.1 hypothetical protein B1964_07680 [Gordonia sp. i37]
MSNQPDGGDLPPQIDFSRFSGWVRFADLPTADVPRGPGVYVVVRGTDEPPVFLDVSPAGHWKGRDPTELVDALQDRWVPESRVLYIGKANVGTSGRRGLRRRLDEYRRYGSGEPVAHSGGRRIWQLADHADLLVAWRETPDADAAAIESSMILAFAEHYGRLPYANARR